MSSKTVSNSFILANLNGSVRPQDDFFVFVAGKWLKRNPIPPTEAKWGSFHVLREKSREELRRIAEKTTKRKPTAGSEEGLIRNFWLSGMDEEKREVLGVDPIKQDLQHIEAIRSIQDVIDFTAYGHKFGFDILWHSSVEEDAKNSSRNAFYLMQDGISLPDRDFYLKDDPESKRVRVAYLNYLKRMIALPELRNIFSAKAPDTIMRIETELAKASMTRVERRDVEKQYNKWTLGKLSRATSRIAWPRYFKRIGISAPRDIIVAQPRFIARINKMLREVRIEDWKVYLRWKVVDGSVGVLNRRLIRENFDFYAKALSGVRKMRPLWKRVVGMIDGSIGEALGKLYVKEHFNQESKRKINRLVDDLFAAYRERIKHLDWMGSGTKKKALKKLGTMVRKLGYPSVWKGYRGLKILPGDYFGNVSRAHQFEWERMLRKLPKKPDRREWLMTPPTVNAYFNPTMNEIVFPAGIMQSPFFDAKADDAFNYGAIGSVIGHEITHGFDDEGRKFDEKGNLKNWWTKKDKARFVRKAEVLRKQYDGFVAVDGMRVNGKLTLGENIADLGGLVMAFKAFQKSQRGKQRKSISGFTPEQQFFIGYAVTEISHTRPKALKKMLVVDTHSPSKLRVNGPLSNMEEFYMAFGVKRGDKLYREPKQRAQIW